MAYRWLFYDQRPHLEIANLVERAVKIDSEYSIPYYPCFMSLKRDNDNLLQSKTLVGHLDSSYFYDYYRSKDFDNRVAAWKELGRQQGLLIGEHSILDFKHDYAARHIVPEEHYIIQYKATYLLFDITPLGDRNIRDLWLAAFFMRLLLERTATVDTFYWLKENYGHAFKDFSDFTWLIIAEQNSRLGPINDSSRPAWRYQAHHFLSRLPETAIAATYLNGGFDTLKAMHEKGLQHGNIYTFDYGFARGTRNQQLQLDYLSGNLNDDVSSLEKHLKKINRLIQLYKKEDSEFENEAQAVSF